MFTGELADSVHLGRLHPCAYGDTGDELGHVAGVLAIESKLRIPPVWISHEPVFLLVIPEFSLVQRDQLSDLIIWEINWDRDYGSLRLIEDGLGRPKY